MARPDLSYLKNLLLFVCGLPFGALTGLTGLASAPLLDPAARFLLGRRPGLPGAILAGGFCAAVAALLSYGQHGAIRGGLAVLLMVGQIVGIGWGQRLRQALPHVARLSWLWTGLLLAAGLGIVFHATGPGPAVTSGIVPAGSPAWWLWALVVAVVVGIASRMMALGGVLLVPAEIYALNLPPLTAAGTALVVLVLAALPSLLVQARHGSINAEAAPPLSLAGFFGGLVGAYWAVHLRPAAFLSLLGLALLLIAAPLPFRKNEAI